MAALQNQNCHSPIHPASTCPSASTSITCQNYEITTHWSSLSLHASSCWFINLLFTWSVSSNPTPFTGKTTDVAAARGSTRTCCLHSAAAGSTRRRRSAAAGQELPETVDQQPRERPMRLSCRANSDCEAAVATRLKATTRSPSWWNLVCAFTYFIMLNLHDL